MEITIACLMGIIVGILLAGIGFRVVKNKRASFGPVNKLTIVDGHKALIFGKIYILWGGALLTCMLACFIADNKYQFMEILLIVHGAIALIINIVGLIVGNLTRVGKQ